MTPEAFLDIEPAGASQSRGLSSACDRSDQRFPDGGIRRALAEGNGLWACRAPGYLISVPRVDTAEASTSSPTTSMRLRPRSAAFTVGVMSTAAWMLLICEASA